MHFTWCFPLFIHSHCTERLARLSFHIFIRLVTRLFVTISVEILHFKGSLYGVHSIDDLGFRKILKILLEWFKSTLQNIEWNSREYKTWNSLAKFIVQTLIREFVKWLKLFIIIENWANSNFYGIRMENIISFRFKTMINSKLLDKFCWMFIIRFICIDAIAVTALNAPSTTDCIRFRVLYTARVYQINLSCIRLMFINYWIV